MRIFLKSYARCACVDTITIVWSDPKSSPPEDLVLESKYPNSTFEFEVHKENSLSNRFRPLTPVPTEVKSGYILDYHLYFNLRLF